MPGGKGEGDWQGRGEPAVAALFKGSALRWALGIPFTGCGAPAIRLFPAHQCTLGRAAFLPFFGGLGGPFFFCSPLDGGVQKRGLFSGGEVCCMCALQRGKGKPAHFSVGRGCLPRREGVSVVPGGRGAHRTRLGREALCTVGGKVSVCRAGRGRGIGCARQGVWARRTRQGRGAPVCPTGGRGTLCTEGERYLLCPEGRGSHRVRTKGERDTCHAWRGEGAPVTPGGERRAPAASDGGERRLRGRRGRLGPAGCRGSGGPSHWAEGGTVAPGRGGPPRLVRGAKGGRGEIANKKRVILCIL